MPVLSFFYGIKITMYYDDHNPPHFHAEYSDYKALISIHDGAIIEGIIPIKQMKQIETWLTIHQEELMQNWELAREQEQLIKIEPLI